MSSSTLLILAALLLSLASTGCSSRDDEEAACLAKNDPTPVYAISGSAVISPAPKVGSLSSVFVTLTAHDTTACHWSNGYPDTFSSPESSAEPEGCYCEPDPEEHVPFEMTEASCPDGSCVVLSVGDYVEPAGLGTGEREVQLVPHATSFKLTLRVSPDANASAVVEDVYVGTADP